MSARDTLAAWLDARGRADPIDLWWRDDDLETASPALDACLDALAALGVTPAFAAIPAGLRPPALEALDGIRADILPHGWSHANHAAAGEKKCEFGPARPADERLGDIARGWERVQALAADRAVACFVPPWNRIGDDLLARLDETGLAALSGFASRRRAAPPAAVPRLDTHIDLIDWRGTGGPITADALAATLVERFREQDGVDAPLGILSHHRVTGREAWAAWQPVLALLSDHPAIRWLSPRDALARVAVEPTERRNG